MREGQVRVGRVGRKKINTGDVRYKGDGKTRRVRTVSTRGTSREQVRQGLELHRLIGCCAPRADKEGRYCNTIRFHV